MYVTIVELAEYLGVHPEYLLEQIQIGNVNAVFDGKQYLINKAQFEWHKEQIEKKLMELKEEQMEPLPEDPDVKDED
ncbi:excisionase family DNA-binding protein [Desertibacillus haloalkaliphilus]|uniref:excisionase family DNA-binding protein n=1 Tax=Desertibacillus haloalkaliphilus TaxID=1328930 RepID=UPI001C27CBDF|nr:excisionase family DNA-binding protein [Desertibacillus haloalkaliphilus]MBU8906919.1 excisionase family DNA-binding protein [Desertibacillus haloalkaliphilus]